MGVGRARDLASLLLAACLLAVVPPARGQERPEEATLAVPALSLTFSSTFLAEELGLWEKEGLRVRISTVAGVGAANAVLAGSVDFSPVSSATLVRADARGQKLFAIAQLMDRMPIETVLPGGGGGDEGRGEAAPAGRALHEQVRAVRTPRE